MILASFVVMLISFVILMIMHHHREKNGHNDKQVRGATILSIGSGIVVFITMVLLMGLWWYHDMSWWEFLQRQWSWISYLFDFLILPGILLFFSGVLFVCLQNVIVFTVLFTTSCFLLVLGILVDQSFFLLCSFFFLAFMFSLWMYCFAYYYRFFMTIRFRPFLFFLVFLILPVLVIVVLLFFGFPFGVPSHSQYEKRRSEWIFWVSISFVCLVHLYMVFWTLRMIEQYNQQDVLVTQHEEEQAR